MEFTRDVVRIRNTISFHVIKCIFGIAAWSIVTNPANVIHHNVYYRFNIIRVHFVWNDTEKFAVWLTPRRHNFRAPTADLPICVYYTVSRNHIGFHWSRDVKIQHSVSRFLQSYINYFVNLCTNIGSLAMKYTLQNGIFCHFNEIIFQLSIFMHIKELSRY